MAALPLNNDRNASSFLQQSNSYPPRNEPLPSFIRFALPDLVRPAILSDEERKLNNKQEITRYAVEHPISGTTTDIYSQRLPAIPKPPSPTLQPQHRGFSNITEQVDHITKAAGRQSTPNYVKEETGSFDSLKGVLPSSFEPESPKKFVEPSVISSADSEEEDEKPNQEEHADGGDMDDGDDSMIFDLDPDINAGPKTPRPESDSTLQTETNSYLSWGRATVLQPLSPSSQSLFKPRAKSSVPVVNSTGILSVAFQTASSKPYSYQTAPSQPGQTRPYRKLEQSTLKNLFERHGMNDRQRSRLTDRLQKVTLRSEDYQPSIAVPFIARPSVWEETDQEGFSNPNPVWSGFEDENDWSGRGMHVDLKKGETLELEPLDEFVGHGSTAAVDLVRCRGIKLARKTVLLRRNLTVKDVLQEVYALHKLRHSHIIRLVGTYSRGPSFRILLYPVADHTLADLMVSLILENGRHELHGIQQGRSPWKTSFSQSSLCLISALRYIHSQGIKHMDIKPQNILVKFIAAEAYKMYLCDFGVSHIFEAHHSQTDSFFGRTPRYAAPEVASDESHGRAADIFSMGCVLAEMNSVFSDFSILEFDTYRQGAMIIPSGTRRASHETTSSVPYNQTVERAQEWIRSLRHMEVDPWTIALMLAKDPAKRPVLHVNWKAGITLRCSHDTDGPEPYDYDHPTALSAAAPAFATEHPEAT